MHDVMFAAPGEGSWELESTHFQRPISRFASVPFTSGFPRGFAEGSARYGMMLDHMEPAVVNGFLYTKLAFFGHDRPGGPTPEEMQARVMTSVAAFEQKQWRKDLAQWDEVDRPAAIAEHRALQEVDPGLLSDRELATHLIRCQDHVESMYYLHHKYTATAMIAVGDFLAAAQESSGAPVGELMAALRGTSPVSTGFAEAELNRLADAIRASATASAIVSAAAPAAPADETLALLVADPEVGADARAYLDAVRFRSVGYDVSDPTAGEMPEMLVETVRAAVAGAGAAPQDDAKLAAIRARVPVEHLAEFDEQLVEARLMNRLRDERGAYSDGWGTGLARRAILEAGRRLHEAGKLADAAHAVDMDADELGALLRGEPGPSAEEVAERFRWRTTHSTEDAPPLLGPVPDPPPPLEALPPPARRSARITGVAMTNLFGVSDTPNSETVLHGLAVNDGTYEGTARLVDDASDFGRVQQGDVLVARVTSPYFNVVLPLLGAIVTDRGGQLCHAAIVAREYGIPGIVGTRDATRTIPDGARVRVDGRTGEVRLLG
jgi:rifampicin phosphotransferase